MYWLYWFPEESRANTKSCNFDDEADIHIGGVARNTNESIFLCEGAVDINFANV